MKQPGGFAVWQEPFSVLRVPKVFNLRMDRSSALTSFPISTTIGSWKTRIWLPSIDQRAMSRALQ